MSEIHGRTDEPETSLRMNPRTDADEPESNLRMNPRTDADEPENRCG
jgi:hypothetical protein